MSWRAWAASLVLHSGIAALLLGLATVNPSPDRTARWEVQLAFAAPPEPPAAPAPPATATETPVQPPLPPPVAPAAQPTPALSAHPQPPPIAAAIKPPPPPKRAAPPPIRQPRPPPEKPVDIPRKPSPSPPADAAKATPRPPRQKAASPFSTTPSRPTPQEVRDSSRTAFTETGATSSGRRAEAEVGHRAEQSPARNAAPPAKPDPKPAADWHAALRAKLRELRVYPPVARRLGQEGIVTLLLEIGANGDVRGLAVRQSSGHAVLDQAAQQLARNAVAALRGQLSPPGESRLEIPVAYRLDR
ncbi:MAG: TonB family protein [Candidatus Competibacteraceae bacterium]|nr:TonB family protein [Candidatus Competibacteraceae bacterium]